MNFIKKFVFLICIILVFLSLYKDINKEMFSEQDEKGKNAITIDELKVIRVKVIAGDTVLSISERLNGNKLKNVHIDEIMADFKRVNPAVDPYHLIIGTMYYFPLY